MHVLAVAEDIIGWTLKCPPGGPAALCGRLPFHRDSSQSMLPIDIALAHCGVDGSCASSWVIRPDGHIGWFSLQPSPDGLRSHLKMLIKT